ncbi:GGDEF domain-containing protein [Paraglaciecola aquimarina]|uniref:diguanylate cyclase n=1 Tax=Paraglaciecola algarum TaxID=3050085 RepID=A0ABS9D7P2_9ALTE|nr:GGDEF domain-containing protein [Paraglaciecola sp. G1-23]MCF2948978.1 GGDEF domain-containing protein [Paraglaciecola sp. G1-23]
MSKIISKIKHFCWLFLTPLALFIGLVFTLQIHHPALDIIFLNLNWLIYLCIALSSVIALFFGQSRLVYACFILLYLTPVAGPFLGPDVGYLTIKYIFIQLAFTHLIFSRDKGFSPLNTVISLVFLGVIWLISFFAVPQLNPIVDAWYSAPGNLLLELSRSFDYVIGPLEFVILCFTLTLCLLRFIWLTTNTHNALFSCIVITGFIQFSNNTQIMQLGVVFLSLLIGYSVIRDSFTMAFKDELTGIPSRRAMMQYVQTLGRKYSVVMSDIDHFKKFNDTYGHDVGDEVLKLVASKLNKVTGGGKTFRFGGEEFVIIFPRKNANEVLPFVEVVRQVIADYDIALRTKPRPAKAPKASNKKGGLKQPAKEKIVKVTSSFGVAQRTKGSPEFTQVMKQADLALYAAKKAGRNCVKVAKQ